MKDFVKLSDKYRVRIDQFNPKLSWISKETFDTYEDAWNYALQEYQKFGACGFCVIYDELPELELNLECQSLAFKKGFEV